MNYTLGRMERDLFKIQEQIEKSGTKFDEIVGLARGGVIPATLLSYRLDLPLKLIDWSFRDHKRVDWNSIDNVAFKIYSGRKYLIVDDILDSGATLSKFYQALDTSATGSKLTLPSLAVLVSNLYPEFDIRPTYYGRTINRNEDKEWVNFWWEDK